MKKFVLLLSLIAITLISNTFIVRAEDYQNYQEIVFNSDNAKLLKDYSDSEINDLMKKIKGKRFIGWKLDILQNEEDVEFISETKLKIYNNGFSTIKHDITLETKEETKYQLSASGGIKISGKGNIKKFKGSIDANIKAAVSYSNTTISKETYEFNIVVDPMTYVKIVTRGKGIINNGIGKYYFFWVNTKSGGWETFTVTTEYYEIVKEKIK